MNSTVMTDAVRAGQVARNTRLLAGAQVMLWASAGAFAAFGPIAVFELSGRESLVGVLLGLYSLGAASGAILAGRLMDRAGRRPGLAAGYLLLGLAGLGSFLSIVAGSAAGLLIMGLVLGLGAAGAFLGRAAVADMYPLERRGRAVGTLVMAGTIGAVGGPLLAGWALSLARRAGAFEPLAGPWVMVPVLSAVALVLVLALRPDPRDLAVEGPAEGGRVRRPGEILRLRPGTAALATIGVAQAVMVTFMSIIPVVIHHHGAGELTVSLVVSGHLAGMFAFSRLIGAALDRWGRRPGLLAGALTTAAGVLLGSLGTGTLVPATGLFLIGVGWCAAYLGSTAVISDLSKPRERGRALGVADLVAAAAAGTGTLGGAVLLEATSMPMVGAAALGLLAVVASMLVPLREASPGQWAGELRAEAASGS